MRELTTEKERISRTRQKTSIIDYAKENRGVVIWKYTEIILKTKVEMRAVNQASTQITPTAGRESCSVPIAAS